MSVRDEDVDVIRQLFQDLKILEPEEITREFVMDIDIEEIGDRLKRFMIRNKSKALKKAPLIIKKMTEIQNMKATYLEEDVSKLIADMKKSEEMSDDLRPAVPSRRVRHPPVNEVGDHPIDPQLDMNTRNIEDELRQLIEERRRDLALRPIDIIDPLCPMHFTGIQVDPERLQDNFGEIEEGEPGAEPDLFEQLMSAPVPGGLAPEAPIPQAPASEAPSEASVPEASAPEAPLPGVEAPSVPEVQPTAAERRDLLDHVFMVPQEPQTGAVARGSTRAKRRRILKQNKKSKPRPATFNVRGKINRPQKELQEAVEVIDIEPLDANNYEFSEHLQKLERRMQEIIVSRTPTVIVPQVVVTSPSEPAPLESVDDNTVETGIRQPERPSHQLEVPTDTGFTRPSAAPASPASVGKSSTSAPAPAPDGAASGDVPPVGTAAAGAGAGSEASTSGDRILNRLVNLIQNINVGDFIPLDEMAEIADDYESQKEAFIVLIENFDTLGVDIVEWDDTPLLFKGIRKAKEV